MNRINTELDIVNEALKRCKHNPITADQLENFSGTYGLVLGDILEERPWLFSLGMTTRLTTTSDGEDLGYTHRYILPSDVLDVVAVDTGDPYLQTASIEEGLRAGYDLDAPSDRAINYNGSRQFVFVNGILHTDYEPNRIFYKRVITPDVMPDSFKMLLVFKLAIQFERDLNGDPALLASLKTDLTEQYVRATRAENQRPHDPYLAGIYDWVIQYYSASRTRY